MLPNTYHLSGLKALRWQGDGTHFECFGETEPLLFFVKEKFTSVDSKSKWIITKAFSGCNDSLSCS